MPKKYIFKNIYKKKTKTLRKNKKKIKIYLKN